MNTKIDKNFFKKKKHAEQFFISKSKKYPYYFKNKNLDSSIEKVQSKNYLSKNFEYGVKGINKSFYFEIKVLVSLMKYLKRFSKLLSNDLKLSISVFPDTWLTSKPREIRMGKGKGKLSKKVYFFKKGGKILEFNINCDPYKLKEFLRRCFTRIPCKFKLLKRYW